MEFAIFSRIPSSISEYFLSVQGSIFTPHIDFFFYDFNNSADANWVIGKKHEIE